MRVLVVFFVTSVPFILLNLGRICSGKLEKITDISNVIYLLSMIVFSFHSDERGGYLIIKRFFTSLRYVQNSIK